LSLDQFGQSFIIREPIAEHFLLVIDFQQRLNGRFHGRGQTQASRLYFLLRSDGFGNRFGWSRAIVQLVMQALENPGRCQEFLKREVVESKSLARTGSGDRGHWRRDLSQKGIHSGHGVFEPVIYRAIIHPFNDPRTAELAASGWLGLVYVAEQIAERAVSFDLPASRIF